MTTTARVNRVEIRVPASTSNLGPGFDAIGMALGLYNEFLFEWSAGISEVYVEGAGSDVLTCAESRTLAAFERAHAIAGVPAPAVRIVQHNAVPLARGLGGSGTAALAGSIAGFIFAGRPYDRAAMLDLAFSMEGHPDNVTPSFVGGLVACLIDDEHVEYVRVAPPTELSAVVLIPDRPLDTGLARQALPALYSRADMIFNVRGAAAIAAGLATGQLDNLCLAMRDRLHQPYREPLLPGMSDIMRAAVAAGSLGAALSGAGSGIFAFATGETAPAIGAAMEAAAAAHGMNSYSLYLPIDTAGVQIVDIT